MGREYIILLKIKKNRNVSIIHSKPSYTSLRLHFECVLRVFIDSLVSYWPLLFPFSISFRFSIFFRIGTKTAIAKRYKELIVVFLNIKLVCIMEKIHTYTYLLRSFKESATDTKAFYM